MKRIKDSKTYTVQLPGNLRERLESEIQKGIFGYTTIFKMALSDFFDKVDELSKKDSIMMLSKKEGKYIYWDSEDVDKYLEKESLTNEIN